MLLIFFLGIPIVCTLLVVLLLALANVGGGGFSRRFSHGDYFEEHELPISVPASTNKIAIISLNGVISYQGAGATGSDGMVGDIITQLKGALQDPRVKAIILKIDSPGGEVTASDVLYQQVAEARRYKPVVVKMDSMAASGGYYIAVAADHIIAHEYTITGSIGVILQTFNFKGLLDKIGVEPRIFKSGRYKDMLNPATESSPEEEALIADLIKETHERFTQLVAENRKIPLEQLTNTATGYAQGQIFSGRQAKDIGLVDEIGLLEDAVETAKLLANIEDAKVVQYRPKFNLGHLFGIYGNASNAKPSVELNLSPEILPRLEAGKLYFISSHLFR